MEVTSYLVSPPGRRSDPDEAEPRLVVPSNVLTYNAVIQSFDMGLRLFAPIVKRTNRCISRCVPSNDRQVDLPYRAIPELVGEIACGLRMQSHDHRAGCHPVETVHDVDRP